MRGDQQPAARLVEHVLELARAVGRVDVDQDRRRPWPSAYWTSTHSAQLGAQMPMRSPGSQARGDQRPRHAVDAARRARRRSSRTSWWRTTSASRSPMRATARVEVLADRLAEQRRRRRPVRVRERHGRQVCRLAGPRRALAPACCLRRPRNASTPSTTHDEHEAVEDRDARSRRRRAAARSSLTMPQPSASSATMITSSSRTPRDAPPQRRVAARRDQAHEAQRQQLAVATAASGRA